MWSWEADKDFDEQVGDSWLILLPNKFNRQVHYGWRFAPAQLSKERRARAEAGASLVAERAEGADECADNMNPRPQPAKKKKQKKHRRS